MSDHKPEPLYPSHAESQSLSDADVRKIVAEALSADRKRMVKAIRSAVILALQNPNMEQEQEDELMVGLIGELLDDKDLANELLQLSKKAA